MVKKKPIQIPDSALVLYQVPNYTAGKYSRSSSHSYRLKTEEEARRFAAGGMSNGSGFILKIISFTEYVREDNLQGYVEYKLEEELPPVTEFTPDGQKKHERYLELINCKHKNTRGVVYGAGCQKDVDIECTNCGEVVG